MRERRALIHVAGPTRLADLIVLGLFFFSGASALIYEVVWSRMLTFVFGGTALAITTVLAAYMAGLALGSWSFGRRIDRGGHPLVVYALLEAGIAFWAFLLPLLLGVLDDFYGFINRQLHPETYALSLVRFALSFVVLLVPTVMMGGTLPVLSKLLAADRRTLGLKTGLLYATNTIGAVVGTATAGFLLIPGLGMKASTSIAVLFNLAVALAAFFLRGAVPWSPPVPGAQDSEPAGRTAARPAPASLKSLALLVYALSGFAALIYEVAWTKVLSGALGTTTYAFSAMLTTFLLGLSLGAFLFARLADKHDVAPLLAWTQLAIGLLGLAALPLFGNLPVLFIQVFKAWGPSWTSQTLAKFALCAITLLPPTILMGATFPLVARLYADRPGQLGRQVGTLYAANTVGAILGSVAAGFFLIPLLGRQGTLLAAVLVNVTSAVLLYASLFPRLTRSARIAALATGLALVPLAVLGAKPWDKHLMSSGAYIYAEAYSGIQGSFREALQTMNMIYFKEESEAVISVVRVEHVLSLRINGKSDASTAGDMLTQKLLSHLPILHHKAPSDVLVIGLGSGISLGSALVYPEVNTIECVEMLSGVREASRHFTEFNHDCLADPRTRLIINDGRNHLKLTPNAYDVIISEPSNPWIVGIGSLFTREFFELGANRLKPGGIFCQWVQTYNMSRRNFGSVLATFQAVFPHVSIWTGAPGDVILLGSLQPLSLDYGNLERAYQRPTIAGDLSSIHVRDPLGILQNYVGGRETLDKLAARSEKIITDDNLLLEFSMPKDLYSPSVEMMDFTILRDVRSPATAYLDTGNVPADSLSSLLAALERHFRGRDQVLAGIEMAWTGDYALAADALEKAYLLAPADPLIPESLGESLNETGRALNESGHSDQARTYFQRAAAVGGRVQRAVALNHLGLDLYSKGHMDSAEALWNQAVKLEPTLPALRVNRARYFARQGRPEEAIADYRVALEGSPIDTEVLRDLALLLADSERTAGEAVDLARRLIKAGSREEARPVLNRIVQSGGSRDVVLKAERLLKKL